MNTKMQNINVLKVSPFEIAKASDVDLAFRDILNHLGLFVNYCFGYHTPVVDVLNKNLAIDDEGQPRDYMPIGYEREIKDFVIGGGLEQGSSPNTLRLLPIIAFSKEAGLFISNGKNHENKDIEVALETEIWQHNKRHVMEFGIAEEAYSIEAGRQIHDEYAGRQEDINNDSRFKIVSIYIGDAQDKKNQEDWAGIDRPMKDLTWEEYEYQWRASALGEGYIKEFAKRQTQSIRLYALSGDVVSDFEKATAPYTPEDREWRRRVKIAEVLVSYTMKDQDGIAVMNPIRKDDIHFVTATQSWEDQNADNNHKLDGQSSYELADAKWLKHVPNKNIEMKRDPKKYTAERKKLWARAQDALAFRAEHYNYRWTNEKTKTYSLGSIAELNERIHKIHKKDGTLKEEVVNRENIYLQPMDSGDQHSLRGEHICIRHVSEIDKKNGINPEIPLQYEDASKNKISINDYDRISTGL